MLRFPNPGSHIDGFIKIYKELFDAFESYPFFTLDDISRALVERNLATSSGYIGEEALTRSTRQDRSRDPLYNQSKMYAELFRMLGWFQSLPESSLKYRLSYLGAHIAYANEDPKSLFRESILGIAFPNSVLEVKGNHALRPFSAILKTMSALNGTLCRDEMIIGPMSLANDRSNKDFQEMLSLIKNTRGSFKNLQIKIKQVSQQRKISTNTMHNYTRFPLAVLVWCGWTKKVRNESIYKKPIVFQELTPLGEQQSQLLNNAIDLRCADFKKISTEHKSNLSRFCFYSMLSRAGFDLSLIQDDINNTATAVIAKIFPQYSNNTPLIFSPFQEFNLNETQDIFPETNINHENRSNSSNQIASSTSLSSQLFSDVTFEQTPSDKIKIQQESISTELMNTYSSFHDINTAIDTLITKYQIANKNIFYPLISELFCLLGYDCDHSRIGVNYQRWDALIKDQQESIPIEIKSPGEELYISVKAVRQAIENKIILTSRQTFPTTLHTTTLVVGFYLPNDRSEVSTLIEDMFKIFQIRIGVIDFRNLLIMCYEKLINNRTPKKKDLSQLYGFIKI